MVAEYTGQEADLQHQIHILEESGLFELVTFDAEAGEGKDGLSAELSTDFFPYFEIKSAA